MGLSWKPQRRGDIYCAPACGGRCTWERHQEAVRLSAATAKDLGPGWTSEVTENLGWHWSVKSPCGRLKVQGYRNFNGVAGSFTALLNEPNRLGGRWAASRKTARGAIRKVLELARGELAVLNSIVDGLTVPGRRGPRRAPPPAKKAA